MIQRNWKNRLILRDTPFMDLMRRRIFNVLLIANPYDAFMLEDDGRVDEKIFDEYAKLGLRYPPRFYQVASAEEALALCGKKGPPDVVVTDVHMPGGMTGLELLSRMKKSYPSARVILLAGMPLKSEVDEAKSNGAAGYMPKSSKRGVLAAAIRRVAADPAAFVEEGYVQPKTILSAREAEILRYMAMGKTREEIAIILGIGFETVRTHTKNLITKLDATNSAGAVSRAYELGLLRA